MTQTDALGDSQEIARLDTGHYFGEVCCLRISMMGQLAIEGGPLTGSDPRYCLFHVLRNIKTCWLDTVVQPTDVHNHVVQYVGQWVVIVHVTYEIHTPWVR